MIKICPSFQLPHDKSVELTSTIVSDINESGWEENLTLLNKLRLISQNSMKHFNDIQIDKSQVKDTDLQLCFDGSSVPNANTKKIPLFYEASPSSSLRSPLPVPVEAVSTAATDVVFSTMRSLDRKGGTHHLALVLTDGEDRRTWVEVARYPLDSRLSK